MMTVLQNLGSQPWRDLSEGVLLKYWNQLEETPEMGVALINHPFIDGIFHYKPTIFGDPPFMETPVFEYHEMFKKTWKIMFGCFWEVQISCSTVEKNLHLLIK